MVYLLEEDMEMEDEDDFSPETNEHVAVEIGRASCRERV